VCVCDGGWGWDHANPVVPHDPAFPHIGSGLDMQQVLEAPLSKGWGGPQVPESPRMG
jgi:hypothetical protein